MSQAVDRAYATGQAVESALAYYAITFTVSEEGDLSWSAYSEWVGQGSRPAWSLRAPSLVNPELVRHAWDAMGMASMVVNDRRALALFSRVGGHALVAEPVVTEFMSFILEPVEYVSEPMGGPLRPVRSLPNHVLQHAPSRKVRFAVLRRDRFVCRACGRGPASNVDIELNVHHILPWGLGGTTEPANLITLCRTCHTGLDPHYTVELFGLVDESASWSEVTPEEMVRSHEQGVARYRACMGQP